MSEPQHRAGVDQNWDEQSWNRPAGTGQGPSDGGRGGHEATTTATLPAIGGQDPFAGDRRPDARAANSPAAGGFAPPRTGGSPSTGSPAPTATPPAPTPPAPVPAGTASGSADRSTTRDRSTTKPRRPRADSAPRRARLTLRHVNPWSVLKFSCVLAVALFFVWLILVGVLYGLLDASGVFDRINETVNTINGDSKNVITPSIVFGGAAVIGAVNIVLFIALSTIGSVIYNLCADLVGGVEVTLSERE